MHNHLARRTINNPDVDHRLHSLGVQDQAAELQSRGYTILENALSERTTDALRKAIVAEIRRIREESVIAEELADAKAYLTVSFVFGYETAEQLAGALLRMQIYGLGFDYPEKHVGRVAAVTVVEVLRVAKEHLHPDKLVTVVVGP